MILDIDIRSSLSWVVVLIFRFCALLDHRKEQGYRLPGRGYCHCCGTKILIEKNVFNNPEVHLVGNMYDKI